MPVHSANAIREQRKEWATVSAVIPAYNAAETIERALDSVYAQTYDNIIEVIVVDDGSTDDTAAIVREKYPQVTLIQQENAGAASARNMGIELASADCIAFLDSDDEWLPQRIEKSIGVITSRSDIDFCGCLFEVVTSRGEGVPAGREQPGVVRPVEFGVYIRRGLRMGITPVGPRVAIQSVGGFDPDMPSFEELDIWLRLLASGYTIGLLQEALYRWYLREESLCHGRTGLKRHRAAMMILDRWAPGHEGHSPLTMEEHTRLRWAALSSAARDHAFYGEYGKARSYAQQALDLSPHVHSARGCMVIRLIVSAPWAYRACAIVVAGMRNVLRAPVWRARGMLDQGRWRLSHE